MHGSGPDEGLGVAVAVVEVRADRVFQFFDTLEDAAADALLGEFAEEALDEACSALPSQPCSV